MTGQRRLVPVVALRILQQVGEGMSCAVGDLTFSDTKRCHHRLEDVLAEVRIGHFLKADEGGILFPSEDILWKEKVGSGDVYPLLDVRQYLLRDRYGSIPASVRLLSFDQVPYVFFLS